jgi:cell wall-associated NlpC family hydrolase
MDGLSGIRQYQTFDIDETLLPNEYTNKLKFITTTVTHKIDTKGWETTVNSLGVPKNNKPTVSVDKDIPKIKIEINKTESPTSTSNGSSTSNLYNEAIKYKDYKYELGSNGKEITITRDGSYKGQVFKTFDCSAFVSRVLGKSRMTSEPLVVGGSNFRTLTNNLKASDLKEGDVIGTDNGPTSFDRGRKYGIDHILIVIKNPNSGQLEIWECNGPSISKYNSKNTNSFGGVKYTSLDVKIKKLNQAKNLYVSSYK